VPFFSICWISAFHAWHFGKCWSERLPNVTGSFQMGFGSVLDRREL